jgi:hypothetical protein
METAGTLEVFAEIAIAIAGFSGVVVALSGTAKSTVLDRTRLHMLLQASLMTAFFSLLPLVLFSTDLEPASIWGVASSCWILYMAVNLTTLRRRVGYTGPAPDTISRHLLTFVFGGVALILVLQVLNAAVMRLAWPHLAALLWGLIIASLFFVRLILSIWSNGEPSES